MMKRTCLAAVAALVVAAPTQAAGDFRLVKSVTIGGDTFWDYLTFDAGSRRLYIAHGTHVVVVDTDSYAVVGDIDGTPGVHGVALAGGLGKGFISAGGSNEVVVFDPKTLAVTGRIPVGGRPDAIRYDAPTRRVLTFNAVSHDTTVIDAVSGRVIGTVALDGKPEEAVSDGHGHLYDNLEDVSQIVEIDAARLRVTHRWSLAPCQEPTGLAFDATHARLFAACGNEMMAVVDARTGRVVTTVPTGRHSDGAGFDPGTGNVLIPDGEGKLTVIHQDAPNRYHLVANVPTQPGARTMAYDPATQRFFTATADLTPNPQGHPRYQMTPGSFRLLVYEP